MEYKSKRQAQNSRLLEPDSTNVEAMKWWVRMNRLVTDKGWTLKELSNRAGVHYENIAKYSRGEVDQPRGNAIGKIAYALGTTEQLLLFGVDSAKKLTNYDGLDAKKLHGTKRIPRITLLELANHHAGHDLLSVWSGEMNIVVDEDVSAFCIAVDIDDNSMLPEFSPGDTLICDPNADIQPGNFVLAKAGTRQKAVFRKYRIGAIDPDGNPIIELKPLNEDYPSDVISKDQPGHIIGRCVKVMKNI